MFFVGATGQLLTLLLTVCLPFVFLVTGHQNLNIKNNNTGLRFEKSLQVVQNTPDFNFNEIQSSLAEKIQESHFLLKHWHFQKIPNSKFQVLWKCNLLLCLGNKAPPSLI